MCRSLLRLTMFFFLVTYFKPPPHKKFSNFTINLTVIYGPSLRQLKNIIQVQYKMEVTMILYRTGIDLIRRKIFKLITEWWIVYYTVRRYIVTEQSLHFRVRSESGRFRYTRKIVLGSTRHTCKFRLFGPRSLMTTLKLSFPCDTLSLSIGTMYYHITERPSLNT